MTTPHTRDFEHAIDRLIDARIVECFGELDVDVDMPMASSAEPVDIVIPVHDAFEAFRECLDSVLAHTAPRHAIILIDDGSRDARVGDAMDRARLDHPHVEVRRQVDNIGYLRTVNRALGASRRDVVVLNSDAMVGAGWIDRLARAAHAEPAIGIACPLSDNATLLSVIEPGQHVIGAGARATRPRLPVAVGFCMYLRRALLDAIGDFDPAFDPGYGEETDFSLRAWNAGFEIVAATDVIVRHRSASSFGHGPEIQRRRAVHERLMSARWPTYESIVTSWWRDWPLREQAERLRRAASPRRRVLHVAHRIQRVGGTELHTRALVRSLARHFDADMLAPDHTRSWADQRVVDSGAGWREVELEQSVRRPNQAVSGIAADLSDPAIERALMRRIVGGRYDIVHVHSQLHWNTLLIPALARAAGARVVVSAHSLESLCPDFLLAPAPSNLPCGKSHAGSDASCLDCLAGQWRIRAGVEVPDKATTLEARWRAWRRAFDDADAVVAPSRFVFERLRRAHGDAIGTRGRVIAHGLAQMPSRAASTPSNVLRVGYFGGAQPSKGVALVVAAAARLVAAPVRFVVHGVHDRRALPAELPPNLEWQGAYSPEHLDAVLSGVDLALLPSRVEETFSLVLSECHAAGVPPIVSRSGALIERVVEGDTGWLLPPGDVDAWTERIGQLATPRGRIELARVAARVAALPRRGIDEEASEVAALYEEILAGAPRAASGAPPLRGTVDVASKRLRDAQRTMPPSLPVWIDRVDDETRMPSPGLALCVVVRAEAHNLHLIDATLASLAGFADVRAIIVAGAVGAPLTRAAYWPSSAITASSAAALRDAVSAAPRSCWHLLVDAGDQLHASLVDWLEHQPPDAAGVVVFDHDLVDRLGHHYAPSVQPPWDIWLARGSMAPARGLVVRDDVLRALGGWTWPVSTATLRMQLRLVEARLRPERIGRVLQHVADNNLSPHQRTPVRLALRDALQDHLDVDLPGWTITPNEPDSGWRLTPPPARPVSVLMLVWDSEAVATDQLERLRNATDWPSLTVRTCTPLAQPIEAALVVFCHASLHPPERRWLADLVAWLQHADALAVGPRQRTVFGRPPGIGFAFDGYAVATIADPAYSKMPYDDEYASAVQAVPALSTRCLLVRSEALDATTIARLGRTDGAESLHAQLEMHQRDGRAVLWVPAVEVEVGRLDVNDDAADDVACLSAACRMSPTIGAAALGPRRRERAGASLADVPKRKPRIAALTRDDWASSQYRVHLPLADLHAAGCIDVPVVWRLRTERAPGWLELEAESPDAVVFHHALDDRSLALLASLAANSSIARVLVIDDLLTGVPASNPMASRLFPDIERRLHAALDTCSVLVATSPELAEAYAARAPHAVVIDNALRAADWTAARARRASSARGSRLRVGWAGAEQHGEEMALLGALMRRHRDVDWAFLGMAPPEALDLGAEVHGMVPFGEYPARLAALGLDIALVPLRDTPFNRCKSALKVIEFGMLGTAVLASALPPYRAAPVLRVDGGLQAWSDALTRLVHDADERAARAGALEAWVQASQLAVHRRDAWTDVLGVAVGMPESSSTIDHTGAP